MGFWPLLFGVKYVSDLPNSMHLQKAKEKQLIGRIKFRISNIMQIVGDKLKFCLLCTS